MASAEGVEVAENVLHEIANNQKDKNDADGPHLCAVGPARRLKCLIEQASRDIEERNILSRAEWNAIADAMNGSASTIDYVGEPIPPLYEIVINLSDSERLDEKWGISTGLLCRKLEDLTPTHGEAIAAAVRWFWNHPEVNHLIDQWWNPEFRKQKCLTVHALDIDSA